MIGFFVVLLAALLLIVFPIWAILKILSLEQHNQTLARRLVDLEERIAAVQREQVAPAPQRPPASASPTPSAVPVAQSTPPSPPPAVAPPRPIPLTPPPPVAPPTVPATPLPVAVEPPSPIAPIAAQPTVPTPPPRGRPRRNWEHFTGAKLFAWIGGIAAFLGAVFFVKYSFDHDLVPPALRVTIGFAFAAALVIAGLTIPRRRYEVTAQTLAATGVVCFYAVTFACSSLYEFPWFTPLKTFAVMAIITTGAFFLAVKLQARVVAVLGLLGGFLTPVLLATGRDNTVGLFSYLALLDVGLIALALHQRWLFLVPLSAAGTLVMELGWASKFLTAEKSPRAMVVCVVFCALFLAGYLISRRLRRHGPLVFWPALAMPCAAFLFAFAFLGFPAIAAQPALLFGFAFGIDACLLTLAWLDEDSPQVHAIGGGALFALLAVWTGARLTEALLPWALGLYLLLGALHAGFPLLLQRRRPGLTSAAWSQFFPALALVLMLIPLVKLDHVPLTLWPCILLLDALTLGLAILRRSIAGLVAALGLTFAATLLWVLEAPRPESPAATALLLVVAAFALFFFSGGLLLARSANDESAGASRVQLSALAVLAPFFLLILAVVRLPATGPSGIFGVALLLTLLTAALVVWNSPARVAGAPSPSPRAALRGIEWLTLFPLCGATLLAYLWNHRHLIQQLSEPAFLWLGGFYILHTVFPFGFRRRFAATTGPWATAALVGVVQFPLVHGIVRRIAPDALLGVVPALFALAPAAAFVAVWRTPSPAVAARLNQLAWFGGVTLLFVTLIIPIQFERQWITLGWALEGVALLWLFGRVPHPGLRATGVALLLVAFVRLALNPAVLEYHPRAETPLINWYLYAYGVVTVCLFMAARLAGGSATNDEPAEAPRRMATRLSVSEIPLPPMFNALGFGLAFLLLNLEIADYFSAPGTRVLTFHFSGNFARDMTYTIAWSVFALGLLLLGIWKRTRAARFAALGLLGVAVLKLFLHDLAHLGALHRIGALFGVAIVAIVASLAYQRWVPADPPVERP